MNRYYLFSTAGCHLCEQAEQLLQTLPEPVTYSIKDIADNDEWVSRYAIRIPVLHHKTSADELNWPFDADALQHFIQHHA